MKSFLSLDDFSNEEILNFCKEAELFKKNSHEKVNFSNKSVATIFLENSTRTKSSFELSTKKLGANVVDLDIKRSSVNKDENIYDTISTIAAMGFDAIIVRNKEAILREFSKTIKTSFVNAGEGISEHPSQVLGDLFTLLEHFNKQLEGKRVAIVGDINYSRVASSHMRLLPRFGVEVSLVGHKDLLPDDNNFSKYGKLKDVIDNVDVLIMLRNQFERHEKFHMDIDYHKRNIMLTKKLLSNKNIIIMHPGPVNRDIDMESCILNDNRCKVLKQVENSIFVRMAIMQYIFKN